MQQRTREEFSPWRSAAPTPPLPDSQVPSPDPLAAVLTSIRLAGAVFFTARITAPWSVASPGGPSLARLVGLQAPCLALFHLVVEGECFIHPSGEAPVRIPQGSIIVFPRGDAHAISSDPRLTPVPLSQVVPDLSRDRIVHVESDGAGTETRLTCGYLQCEHEFQPMIGALPELIVVSARDGSITAAGGSGAQTIAPAPQPPGDGWLERTVRHISEEAAAQRPGHTVMIARMVELLYVEVLRRYAQQLQAGETGWFAAVRDPHVGAALRLLHAEPARKWTVDALARSVGLSRSALGERFAALVGEPPMHYLAAWRMEMARRLLRDPRLGVAQVAAQVGFDSDVAFSRAFKRSTGSSPGAWRRESGAREEGAVAG